MLYTYQQVLHLIENDDTYISVALEEWRGYREKRRGKREERQTERKKEIKERKKERKKEKTVTGGN